MARYQYKISNHLVGVEVGGTGEDRLTATLEIDPNTPTRVYITFLQLVRSKYSAHSASWFNARPFGLYMLLTPDSTVTSVETALVYNAIPSSQYGITSLPACNPYSWNKSTDSALPRINAITDSTDPRKYDSTSGQYEPYHIVVAVKFKNDGNNYIDAADGATATFTADTSSDRLYITLDPDYTSSDEFARLSVKFNQFGTHTNGADWFGWTSTFSLKDALSTPILTYYSNGGRFSSGQTSYIALKSETDPIAIRPAPETFPYHTCNFSVPSGVTAPSSQTYVDTFVNWTTNASGSGQAYSIGDQYSTNADLTLYAHWQQPAFGTLPEVSRPGYTFAGWALSSGGTPIDPTDPIPNLTSFTLYATWAESTHTVWRYESGQWVGYTVAGLPVWRYSTSDSSWHQITKVQRYRNGQWEDVT